MSNLGDQSALSNTNELAETGRVDESGEALTEQVSDNYFERVNAEFERRMLMGEVNDENLRDQLREIRQQEASRERFGGVVADFFRNPMEAVRWLATPFIAPIFTRWAERLGGIRERYEQMRDTVEGEIDEVVENAGEVVDAVQERAETAIEAVREHPFMTAIATTLASFGAIAAFRALPIDFSRLRNMSMPPSLVLRGAPLLVGGLLRFGTLGVAGYGLFRLYDHLEGYFEEHPEALSNIPEGAAEMAEWIRERFEEMNIPEITDEAITYVTALISGEMTPQQIWEETGGADMVEGMRDSLDETIESLQEREGYITVETFVQNQRAALEGLFSPVIAHANSIYQRNEALANTVALMALVSRPGRAAVAMPARAFWSLCRVSTRFLGEHPVAFGGVMAGFGAMAWYISQQDLRLIPDSPERLKADIMEFLVEREDEFIRLTNGQFDLDEISVALDYVLDPSKLAELEINVEDFVDAASDAAVEIIDLSPAERLFAQNDMGISHFEAELGRYLSEHEDYEEIEAIFGEFERNFLDNRVLNTAAIEQLAGTLRPYGVRIEKRNGLYVWSILDSDGLEVIATNNLCIDPELSEGDQYDKADGFYIISEGGVIGAIDVAGTAFNMITQDAREFFGRVYGDEEIPADNPAEWLSNMMLRLCRDDGGVINIVPALGALTVEAAGEAFVLGPISLIGGLISDLVEDGELDAQYLMAEYTDGLMPLLVVGTGVNIVRNLRNGRGPRVLGSALGAATAPLRVTSNYFRYMVFSDYRHRVNASAAESFYGKLESMPFGSSMAQRYVNARRMRSYYEAISIMESAKWKGGANFFRNNEAVRDRVVTLLSTDARYTGHTYNDIKEMLMTRDGLATLKSSVRNHIDIDRALMRGGNNPEAPRTTADADSDSTRAATDAPERTTEASADSERASAPEEARTQDPERIVDDRPLEQRLSDLDTDTARPTELSRTEIDAGVGRIDPSIGRTVDTVRTSTPGRTTSQRIRGTAGMFAVVGGALGAGHIANSMHERHTEAVDTNAVANDAVERGAVPEADRYNMDRGAEVEVAGDSNIENDPYMSAWPELQSDISRISREYDEIDSVFAPENLEDIDGDLFFVLARDFRIMHEQNVHDIETLVFANADLIKEHFRRLDAGSNAVIRVHESIEIGYDAETDNLIIDYTNGRKFENALWDNYDMMRFMNGFYAASEFAGLGENPMQRSHELYETYYAEAEQILLSDASDEEKTQQLQALIESTVGEIEDINRWVNRFYTGSNIALYVAPGTGSYMDARDFGRSVARGRGLRALADGSMFALGTAADFFTIGSGGTAMRATRALEKVATITRTLDRMSSALRSTRITSSMVRNATRAIDFTARNSGRLMLGAMGLDIGRNFLVKPSLDEQITIR